MKSYCELIAKLAYEDGRFEGVINEKILFTISRYSALHDVGKIAIPDKILLKNGKLTPEEFDIIKTHPLIGAEILEEMGKSSNRIGNDIFREAIEIVKYHHEKYDGKGYPEGLKGKEIPIVARIVAIGDVLDALTSKRVYKDKINFDESFEILLAGQGNHFDPDLMDIVQRNKDLFYKLYVSFPIND
jgi:response regulator RpfG family c-di-GMP phosphodiesterase